MSTNYILRIIDTAVNCQYISYKKIYCETLLEAVAAAQHIMLLNENLIELMIFEPAPDLHTEEFLVFAPCGRWFRNVSDECSKLLFSANTYNTDNYVLTPDDLTFLKEQNFFIDN